MSIYIVFIFSGMRSVKASRVLIALGFTVYSSLSVFAPRNSTRNHDLGYVPRSLERISEWSDSALSRELSLLQHCPGNCRGDSNYTLPQREAYELICGEILRRNSAE